MKVQLVASGGGLVAAGYFWGFCQQYGLDKISHAHVKSGSTWSAKLISDLDLSGAHDFMQKHMVTMGDLYDWNTSEIFGSMMFGRKLTGPFTHEDLEENVETYGQKAGAPFLTFTVHMYDFKTKGQHHVDWNHGEILKYVTASSAIGGILKPYKRRYLDLAMNGLPDPEVVKPYAMTDNSHVVFLDAYKPPAGELSDEQLTQLDWKDYLDCNFQIPLQRQSAEYALELEHFAKTWGCGFSHVPIDIEKSITDFSETTLSDSIEAGKRAAKGVQHEIQNLS